MFEQCLWIGSAEEEKDYPFAYFRLDTELPAGVTLHADITAAARYRLWVNGEAVCSGPCAGDRHVWYGDSVDLTPWLRGGRNTFAAQVIALDPAEAVDQGDPDSTLFRIIVPDHRHRFAFSGKAGDLDLSTGKADWRVRMENGILLCKDPENIYLGCYAERADFHRALPGWKTQDCSSWSKAPVLEPVQPDAFHAAVGLVSRYSVEPRPIPLRFRRRETFAREIRTETSLLKTGRLEVPAHSTAEVVLDAGQVKVTEPVFRTEGGDGAKMEITYFEKYTKNGQNIRRDDWQNGEIHGYRDEIVLNGQPLCYEPFYVRTFRFVRMRVTTADRPAVIHAPYFCRTGYPLTTDSHVSSGTPWVETLWKMCTETLQNCMLDTYMDCPYYEQLQFIMDTRLQVLFHFAASRDTRMQRKALEDFHRSILPCGLLPGKYPSAYEQIISTFSLYYIFMIWEYFFQTEDASVLYRYRADCDRILDWFAAHLTDRNLMGDPGYWPFVDWHPAWSRTSGTPEALQYGESTIISLMYAFALENAARINEYSGRPGMAAEYRGRKDTVCGAVQALCLDPERGMYREGPAFDQFTQHAQAWAVLCGLGGTECLRHAMQDKDVLKVSFSTAYEWFRALEKEGLYDEARSEIQPWIDLAALNCMTCPETPGESRSDNHAWSALPMLELIRGVAGIRQTKPGWREINAAPHLWDLTDLSGTAATPRGEIRFSFSPERCEITLPEGMSGNFRCRDGRTVPLHSGRQVITGS